MTDSKKTEDGIQADEVTKLLEAASTQYDQYVQLALLAAAVADMPETRKNAPAEWTHPMGFVITDAGNDGILG